MTDSRRPCLINVDVIPFEHEGQQLLRLANREGLTERWLPVRREAAFVLEMFDGSNTLEEIRDRLQALKVRVELDHLVELTQQLDECLLLDGPAYQQAKANRLQQFALAPVRESSLAGTAYPEDPARLRRRLRGLFEHVKGPGSPLVTTPTRPLRGLLSPHIDFHRGGPTFAWGFKELAEQSEATLFVIIGTAHYSTHRFILSRKDFRTPLGVARNHRGFTEAIATACGPEVFADEIAHRPEHSIEFQVLFLQYLFEGRRDFRFVPLLVGSFHDALACNIAPRDLPEVARMISALRGAAAACEAGGEKVCFISSGDLAHLGPKFDDTWLADEAKSRWCRGCDLSLLGQLEASSGATADALFGFVAAERDQRRLCGLPPTYTMLEAMGQTTAKLLQYDQFVDPRGYEIVSFASMAFYRS